MLYISTILIFYCYRVTEATRNEQEQRNHRPGSQEIERHQHRHDEIATSTIHQNRHLEDGRDSSITRGHRQTINNVTN